MEEKLIFDGQNIEVSEDVKGNLIIDFTICDFEKNANGKKIKRDDVEDKVQTLINMPLVGKLQTKNGVTDFMGHNKKSKYVKEDNKIKVKSYLDTEALGTFTSAEIKEIEGKDYICGQAILWNRFENAKKVVLDRFQKGEPVKSSWEIIITSQHSEIENDSMISVIDDFYFIGNCLLGKDVSPAYKCAGINELLVAEEENDFNDELSSAIAQDIETFNKERREGMENENKDGLVQDTAQETIPVEPQENIIETSSLSFRDIDKKVSKAIYELENNDFWIGNIMIYPLENVAYCSKRGYSNLDEDYLKVSYSMNEEGNVVILSSEDVKMVFMAKAETVTVSEFDEVKKELSEKIDSILKLGESIKVKEETIAEKDKEITELSTFKEQVAEIERIQAEQELSEKRETLREMAISSKYVTEKDIETSEVLKQAIAECDEDKVKIFIGNAVIKSQESGEETVASSTKEEAKEELNLSSTNEYDYKNRASNALLNVLKKRR